MGNSSTKVRNSNLEILRIISMVLIVAHHYAIYGFRTIGVRISPVMNLAISKMSKEIHRNLLIGATILWSIMPSFISANYGFDSLGWFAVLYFFAAYIRKYIDLGKNNARKHFVVSIISYSLVIISNILFIYLGHITGIDMFTNQSTRFMSVNSPFVLVTSIELLIGFVKLKPYYNKVINELASAALGVYLIHDNGTFRPYLWEIILKNSEMYSSNLLFFHALMSIVSVYIVCSGIDLIRQYTFEKVFLNIVSSHLEQIKNKVNRIVNKGSKKIYSMVLWIYK
jgi:hypothetical protein